MCRLEMGLLCDSMIILICGVLLVLKVSSFLISEKVMLGGVGLFRCCCCRVM